MTSLVSGIFLNVFIQKMEFEAPICGEWKIAFSQTIFYSQQKNEAKRAEMTDRISSLPAFLTYGLLNGTPSSFLFQLQNAELLSFCDETKVSGNFLSIVWFGKIFSRIFMVTPEKLCTFILSKNRERLWQRIRPSMCVRIADRNHRSGWGVVLRAGNGILLRNSQCVRRVCRPSRQEDSTRRCRGNRCVGGPFPWDRL